MSREIDRRDVARTLERIAAFMELKGEDPFRIQAFRNGARAVESLTQPIREAMDDGTLEGIRGIGPATMRIVHELVETGHASLLEDLREQVPPGLVEMLAISGLGVTKIRQIHEGLGIDSLPELEAAALDGRLTTLPRFGAKTAGNILKGIAYVRQANQYRMAHHALEEARQLQSALEQLDGVREVHVAGDVRRRMELVEELVLVVVADVPPADVFKRLANLPGVDEFAGQDERVVTLRFASGSSVQVAVTTPVNAGAVLLQATGSRAHLDQLADFAKSKGFALHGAALWRGSEFIPTPDEAALYRALGLAPIAPELREGHGEIEQARNEAMPLLVEEADLKGLLHCHTSASDGSTSIEDLAVAARDAGYEYIGITDHGQWGPLGGGLDPAMIERQAAEIESVNSRVDGIRVLRGIETDILVDGTIDDAGGTLESLDFVIASIHGRFNMTRDDMTTRMLRAMDNPLLTIIGHPTGRLLLARNPYPLDHEAIFAKAAETGVALEINADPHRLDLDWRLVDRAHACGVRISIGADAHNLTGIDNVAFGIGMARKAGLTAGDILNTLPVNEFLASARRGR